MSDEDFLSLLGDEGLRRIEVEKRAELSKKNANDISEDARRRAAVDARERLIDPLSSAEPEMVEPNDFISFQRPGVQHGVYKNLRLGKYSIDAVLDLHSMTVEEARKALWGFIQDCVDNDVRSALVTHGKGEGREKPALLKSYVAHWLPEINEVLAFHTAQKRHGSYGATYVLICKSDKKKFEARVKNERHR